MINDNNFTLNFKARGEAVGFLNVSGFLNLFIVCNTLSQLSALHMVGMLCAAEHSSALKSYCCVFFSFLLILR